MKKIVLLFLLLVTACQLAALVAAHVDRTQIAMGESFALTIDTPNSSTQPDITPLDNDFQVYGTSTKSSTSIINGSVSSQHQTVITLMPKHLGTLTIPALTVGKEKTQPIQIKVTKPTATNLGGEKSNVFLRASVSRRSAYVNSPVIYTLKLYFAQSIQGGNLIPSHKAGVEVKPYGKEQRYSAVVNNKSYQVLEQHYLLSVDHAGNIEIPGITFTGSAIVNNSNDMFSFPASKPISIISNAVDLHILPIPAHINPEQWLPAESVTVKTTWSPQTKQLTVGQPITRTVTLTAIGISANSLPDLNFPVPDNVNAYPDQATTSEQIINGKLVAKKIFKIAYVPTAAGKVHFPDNKITWWDLKHQQAASADIPAVSYPVLQGKLALQTPIVPNKASLHNQQSNPVKTVIINKSANSVWQWLTYIFGGLLLLTLLIIILKKRAKPMRVTETINKDNRANVLLKRVKQACQQNQAKEIQEALLTWAQAYWHDKNLLSLGELNKKVDDEKFSMQVATLEKAIYTQAAYQAGEQLWNALQAYLTTNNEKNKSEDLRPLYPE